MGTMSFRLVSLANDCKPIVSVCVFYPVVTETIVVYGTREYYVIMVVRRLNLVECINDPSFLNS